MFIDQLEVSGVDDVPALPPVHRDLDDVLQQLRAHPRRDGGRVAQRRAGVDLDEPGLQIVGQEEVGPVELERVAFVAELHVVLD